MATARNTWKAFERRVAAVFGCKRQPLSGSSGRSDVTRSDSNHPALFIECKYRESHAARTLLDATREQAKRERKTAVVALADKGSPGFVLCVHSDDLDAFVAEYWAAQTEDQAERLTNLTQQAWQRIREADCWDEPDETEDAA